MLELIERAFAKQKPAIHPPYVLPPVLVPGKPDQDIDPFEENRQKQVVGLIRTNFSETFREFRRLPSNYPVIGCYRSCLPSSTSIAKATREKRRLERWKAQNAEVLGYVCPTPA